MTKELLLTEEQNASVAILCDCVSIKCLIAKYWVITRNRYQYRLIIKPLTTLNCWLPGRWLRFFTFRVFNPFTYFYILQCFGSINNLQEPVWFLVRYFCVWHMGLLYSTNLLDHRAYILFDLWGSKWRGIQMIRHHHFGQNNPLGTSLEINSF